MKKTKYTHRFLARMVVEAKTPLAVGSGRNNTITDSLVVKDVNNLPYIPATSIAGVLCHAIGEPEASLFWGGKTPDHHAGSEVIVTEAKLVGQDGKPIDGLMAGNDADSDFVAHFQELPIRQHVSIDHRGTAKNMGKFDEQIVFKGARFCFELEMVSDGTNFDHFRKVLQILGSDTFRIGSGVHCGFGEIKVVECKVKTLDLTKEEDQLFYMNKSASLASDWQGEELSVPALETEGMNRYCLYVHPVDFFLFGSGFGDDDADMTPVKETCIEWRGVL